MNFQINARLQEYSIADLETIIAARHGEGISELVLYKDNTADENKLPTGGEDNLFTCGTTTILYDYYPPHDPFCNRPVAGGLAATNQVLTLRTFENGDRPVIEPEKLTWSKQAEHDPWEAKRLAEEAARLEAERIAAEAAAAAEQARIEAEIAEAKRKKEEAAKAKAEAAAKAKAEEIREAKEAEERRLKKLEEEAMNDPVKRAEFERKKKEAEEAAIKAEAEAKLAALPKRSKGGAVGLFLGGTTREYYGLQNCTKKDPYLLIAKAKILAEITDKGKIADLYNYKESIEKFPGEEILICKDEDEVYGDNGFVICTMDADIQHFMAHIAAGNGLPPPL